MIRSFWRDPSLLLEVMPQVPLPLNLILVDERSAGSGHGRVRIGTISLQNNSPPRNAHSSAQ